MSDHAIEQLLELLVIDGPPGGEKIVADTIRRQLLEAGVGEDAISEDRAQEQSEYGGDTGNLIVRLDGDGQDPRRLFSCHMDTIPNAVGCAPEREGERIINKAPGKALGGDNRPACAILLEAARALVARQGDQAPTTLAFLIQEEVGLVGARGLDTAMLGPSLPAMGFNFDGGRADRLVMAVIGAECFTIDLSGIEAHAGAHPEQGASCAVMFARALHELVEGGWHGLIEQPGGRGSANLGILTGGQGSNVVMPRLQILAEARSHDPSFRRTIIDVWQNAFRRAATETRNAAGDGGVATFGSGPTYEVFALAEDEPAVQQALGVAAGLDLAAVCESNNGGMDANWLTDHGIPTITIGCGQRQVHTTEEWIDLTDFRRACAFATGLAVAGR